MRPRSGPARGQPAAPGDIRDVTPAELAGYDAVLCLAALSNDPLGDLNPAATYSVNLDGTLHLAQAAKEAGVERFLFASSCSLYGAAGSARGDRGRGPVPRHALRREQGRGRARSLPARGRQLQPHLSPQCHRVRRLAAGSAWTSWSNNLTAIAMTTGQVRLESDGTPWRPLVHIEDISRAFLAMLEAPRELVHDEAFNVGRAAGQCAGPRHRRNGPRRRTRIDAVDRRGRRARPAQLPRRLLQAGGHLPGPDAALECPGGH